MHPIGIIHSPFTEKDQTPIQASRSQAIGMVEVYPEFADGLQDIDGFSHLILLYAFHLSSGYSLYIVPFLDDQQRGVFATRYPYRPNPIGLSVVRLKMRQGAALTVEGVDVLDGTPLLDIKPYVHDFDVQTGIRTGWYENSGARNETTFRGSHLSAAGRLVRSCRRSNNCPCPGCLACSACRALLLAYLSALPLCDHRNSTALVREVWGSASDHRHRCHFGRWADSIPGCAAEIQPQRGWRPIPRDWENLPGWLRGYSGQTPRTD